jgi:hypothetical protein
VYPRGRSARGDTAARGRRAARAARALTASLLIGLVGPTAAPALAKGNGKPSPCVSGPANVQRGKNGKAVGVPEPASWILMLIGAAGVGALTRRRRAEAAGERRTLPEGRNG